MTTYGDAVEQNQRLALKMLEQQGEINKLRQDNRKLIGAVRHVSKLHCLDLPFPANSFNGCGVCIPCNAAKVLSEVEANVGPYQPHNMGDS